MQILSELSKICKNDMNLIISSCLIEYIYILEIYPVKEPTW